MGFDDEHRITPLSDDACWELLEANDLARLAVSVANRPDIYPISYLSRDRKLYLRTSEGSKLLELAINSQVALEVDRLDDDHAMSVVVHGRARRLETEAEIEAVEQLPLHVRLPVASPVYVEITPDLVEGRAFDFTPESER
ncbi:pyridoxamine 5'-phosphate oxidase family protein [Georgenia thermotolerans]|uniref:Pyridoxamine 5'-phosphate oxidase family protein n=1 Tax=Georgenia thermotolerans TaxID=527326 RepID=A0A7J5UTC7_9MICO|nr:pyridoxamine 5'-phosphate oxidase family protein [Georgenia thermotolerans]KAE8765533.1 pyridoxamine 5'-phosphate oxidase family protein [Georgenia thermotolerans]